jgi:hypothetical protein
LPRLAASLCALLNPCRALQALYSSLHSAAAELGVPRGSALLELHTDGFDAEQVWRQARASTEH